MPEKPKPESDTEELSEKCDEQSSWAADQKKHEYYYDDAHGYEAYIPDEETVGEQQENTDPKQPRDRSIV